MTIEFDRKLETAKASRDFCRANPSDNPSVTPILARLEGRISRAEILMAQQRAGELTVRTANGNRKAIRKDMQNHLLPALIEVAGDVAKEEPSLVGRFRLPALNTAKVALVTQVRGMVAEAKAHEELFIKHGLEPTLLEELTKAVDEFEALQEKAHAGKRDHTGARAELVEVMAEIMELIHLLDGLNRYRFRRDAEKMGAWRSARNVFGPKKVRVPETTPEGAPQVQV